jgi:dTMP kinase
MIVAVEGVSCTGKSTLAAALADRLGWAAIGCYYHVADDPSVLGEPLATSEAEQLHALKAHFAIEERRHQQAQAAAARDGGVILDRSVDTLLAHLRAAGRIRGLNAEEPARTLVVQQLAAGAAALPDLTLLLVADPAALAARAASRPGLPGIYYDPLFAAHFNAHFTSPLSPRCVTLDAGTSPAAVRDAALAEIDLAAAVPRRA